MADFQMPPYDLYKVLGVQPGAKVKQIRYHANLLKRTKHPRKCGYSAAAVKEFNRILIAKETLEDQATRRLYDRARDLELSGATPWTMASLTALRKRKRSTAGQVVTVSTAPNPKRKRVSNKKRAPAVLDRDQYCRYEDFQEGGCESELRLWASNVFSCYRHQQHHRRAEENSDPTTAGQVSPENPRFFELISAELLETVRGHIVDVRKAYHEIEMQCGGFGQLDRQTYRTFFDAVNAAKQKILDKQELLIELQEQLHTLKSQSGIDPNPMQKYLRIADDIDRIHRPLADIWGVIGSIEGTLDKPGLHHILRASQDKYVDNEGRPLQKSERDMCIEQFVLLLESIDG